MSNAAVIAPALPLVPSTSARAAITIAVVHGRTRTRTPWPRSSQ
ncbi:MAG: hypothetical protein ACXWVI_08285 [Methyloceanibacter sp.]